MGGMDVPDNWNSMQTIRLGLGYPTSPEFTGKFLDWWKTLTRDQIKNLRHVKPNEIKNVAVPPLNSPTGG